jgi:transposase
MARPLLTPNPENATIEELKLVSRVGSSETATRCTAIQMLLAGADRELVCKALLISNRALRKWINLFNQSGVDGLIAKKRPGRMALISNQQANELAQLIDQPQEAKRTFWTAKAFHGYISKKYQVECSYATVVRFFHKQGFALKTPQPWPDKQDEAFCVRLFYISSNSYLPSRMWISGLPTNPALRVTLVLESVGIKREERPG